MGLDIAFGRPELEAVRKAANADDWPRLMAAITTDVVDDEDRTDRVDVAAQIVVRRWAKHMPAEFDRFVASRPGDATLYLLRGAVEVNRAWTIRGGALARHTNDKKMSGFHQTLCQAEEWLRTSIELAPADPAPWSWLLQSARGLEIGPVRTSERRAELATRDPQHFRGLYQAMMSSSPTWGYEGTYIDYCATAWTKDLPKKSPAHAMIFVANFERWRHRAKGHDLVLRDEEARERARRATDLLDMSKPCTRPAEFWAHNYAAGWFSVAGERKRARAHFALLRGRRTAWPWGDIPPASPFGGTSDQMFRKHRFRAAIGF